MPNWCTTEYALVGDREQLDSLYNKMSELEQMDKPLLPNGFGPNWFGCLVKSLDGDPKAVYCRGNWENLTRTEDGIRFCCIFAWSRPCEVEDLIKSVYPDIDIYYMEEELGMGIFQTNDTDNTYFHSTVVIDIEDGDMDYFDDDGALEALSEIKGEKLSSWEEAEDFVKKNNEKADSDGDYSHIWLHRVDYV